MDRAEHERRIAARARAQFDDGLIEEAVALRERYDPDLPAFSAIGYHEAWDVADGRSTLEEAVAADAQRNVAFAKRQRTWFRSEPDIAWLDTTVDGPVRKRVARLPGRPPDGSRRQPSADPFVDDCRWRSRCIGCSCRCRSTVRRDAAHDAPSSA